MNYKNIRLENENNTHLTKRLNRLSSWGFFKVLYRVNMGKMVGTNLLLLILLLPIAYFITSATTQIANLAISLPSYGSIGIGTGIWVGVEDYLASMTAQFNVDASLWCLLGALPLCLMLSGGFAIIRDAFWTGKLNVFSAFFKGIKANIGYAAVAVAILAGMIVGILNFYWWAITVMAVWLTITLVVLMSITAMLIAIYLLVLCSVAVTYNQGVARNMKDSWYLLWLNTIPNILHFIIAIIPIALFLFISGTLQMIVIAVLLLVGAFYIPFIWQTHMMKTFALFNPVPVNKKGETKVTPSTPNLPTKA